MELDPRDSAYLEIADLEGRAVVALAVVALLLVVVGLVGW